MAPPASQTPTVGETLAPGARPHRDGKPASAQAPASATALALSRKIAGLRGRTLVHLASSERRAEEIGRALAGISPALEVLVLPPWDCLPYDRASPSRDVMGRRMRVLKHLADADADTDTGAVVVTSPEALVQKLPPRAANPSIARPWPPSPRAQAMSSMTGSTSRARSLYSARSSISSPPTPPALCASSFKATSWARFAPMIR
jgi:hypothetical protein